MEGGTGKRADITLPHHPLRDGIHSGLRLLGLAPLVVHRRGTFGFTHCFCRGCLPPLRGHFSLLLQLFPVFLLFDFSLRSAALGGALRVAFTLKLFLGFSPLVVVDVADHHRLKSARVHRSCPRLAFFLFHICLIQLVLLLDIRSIHGLSNPHRLVGRRYSAVDGGNGRSNGGVEGRNRGSEWRWRRSGVGAGSWRG